MRVAIAGFVHETNTFATPETGLDEFGDFTGGPVLTGTKVLKKTPPRFTIHGFAERATESGWEVLPTFHALAQSSGLVSKLAYETLVDRMVQEIQRALPIDAVFLELHGAMVAAHIADADTETVRRVRALVGTEVPIIATLDLHGNTSSEFVDAVDGAVGYRTYPHTDMYETGERAFELLQSIRAYGSSFRRVHVSIPFLMPINRQSTEVEPGRSLYAALGDIEEGCPESTFLTLMSGFSPADVGHSRPAIFGFGPDETVLASAIATLESKVLAAESQYVFDLPDADEAVDIALSLGRQFPVILADVQDNPGGGASADSPLILESLRRAGARSAVVGVVFDPETVRQAHEAGIGVHLPLAVGGKTLKGQTPFEGEFVVRALHSGEFALKGPMLAGGVLDLGDMAHLECDGISVVVSSKRSWYVERSCFEVVGVEPSNYRIVVVKSTNHYRADFAAIAGDIVEFAAPAGVPMDPTAVAYKNLEEGTRLGGLGPAYRKSGA